MQLLSQTIKKSLNKAYLKEKTNRSDIEGFKANLINFLDRINEQESEEHLKNIVADFLKDTWYKDKYEINTKDRKDLVIHTGKTAKESVGVILEVKKPSNKTEMISIEKPNAKAMHELILYYLRERIELNNIDIKYLIITNIYEWYIIDANEFERRIYRHAGLKKIFDAKNNDKKDNTFFYDEVQKLLKDFDDEIPCTYFDIRDYEKTVRNNDKQNDNKLIALYKIFSPVHLLKQPFANDSNSLDTKFYTELLHLIGLEETKDGSKKLINQKAKPDEASLLENTIIKLEDKDCLRNISNLTVFGNTKKEQLFNVALELCITWMNRILFLKLLEAQLSKYHKGNKDYLFLNTHVIFDFDELSNLFFQVLAERQSNRRDHLKEKYSKVPYLNSSLFERTELERQAFDISALDNKLELPLHNATVLKNEQGKRRIGKLTLLQYIFDFLDAYDFTSEGAEEIQEENKNLINASVLGLIFEKINGYKDGSFFTPGFVTMYMCKETIRRAVVQKFNDIKEWDCKNVKELFDKISDKKEANDIINHLTICDPAVGSGHFLVSALNEIIAIKSELKILLDLQGQTLRDYHVEVVNDELIVTDDDGKFFEYHHNNKESQRVQEAFFFEKATIIENCLFGVDINPNSVKICRLRLWIELLKHAYYTKESNYVELETLPNIDINIKCGNSLISRFDLDADLKPALKKSNFSIDSYKIAVNAYRNARTKEEKRELEALIDKIKNDFQTEIGRESKQYKDLAKLETKYFELYSGQLFNQKLSSKEIKKRSELSELIEGKKSEIVNIKENRIFKKAFEWRFEFPEVLSDEGDFVGFDIVIGNPPYVNAIDFKKMVGDKEYSFYKQKFSTAKGTVDLYVYFFEQGFNLLKTNGSFCFITPNRYLSANYAVELRKYLIENFQFIEIGDYSNVKVFAEASTYPVISLFKKKKTNSGYQFSSFTYLQDSAEVEVRKFDSELLNYLQDNILGFILSDKFNVTKKVISDSESLQNAGIINATSTAGEAEKFHDYITESEGFNLINTGTVDRYSTTWGISLLTDKGKKFLRPTLPKDAGLLGVNRYTLYKSPKIIFAKIAIRTEAFFDETGEYASINTNCMHSFKEDYDPYYILGWLNSKLFQYTFECFFDGLKMAGGYLLYSAPNLNNMYIKKAEKIIQSQISKEVKKLNYFYKSNPTGDASDLEKHIDSLFFKLYKLTEEEIRLVEGIY